MKVKVTEKHPGEGRFPSFSRGTKVTLKCENTRFPHWYACGIEGYETYVPISFVSDGRLTRDYNPTELAQAPGDVLEVRERVYGWFFAANEKGTTGWFPAELTVSAENS